MEVRLDRFRIKGLIQQVLQFPNLLGISGRKLRVFDLSDTAVVVVVFTGRYRRVIIAQTEINQKAVRVEYIDRTKRPVRVVRSRQHPDRVPLHFIGPVNDGVSVVSRGGSLKGAVRCEFKTPIGTWPETFRATLECFGKGY